VEAAAEAVEVPLVLGPLDQRRVEFDGRRETVVRVVEVGRLQLGDRARAVSTTAVEASSSAVSSARWSFQSAPWMTPFW
jgi:hypothetical protein